MKKALGALALCVLSVAAQAQTYYYETQPDRTQSTYYAQFSVEISATGGVAYLPGLPALNLSIYSFTDASEPNVYGIVTYPTCYYCTTAPQAYFRASGGNYEWGQSLSTGGEFFQGDRGALQFVAAVVPEPATYGLLLAGLVVTVSASRRARPKAPALPAPQC